MRLQDQILLRNQSCGVEINYDVTVRPEELPLGKRVS